MSAPDRRGHLWPVLIEPRHGFRAVHGTFVCRKGGVFERLLPKPVGGVVDELMQALVAGASFKSVGNPRAGPRAGPSLPGDMHDAGEIGLLEPRRRIKLDRQRIVDGVTGGADQGSLPVVYSDKGAVSGVRRVIWHQTEPLEG